MFNLKDIQYTASNLPNMLYTDTTTAYKNFNHINRAIYSAKILMGRWNMIYVGGSTFFQKYGTIFDPRRMYKFRSNKKCNLIGIGISIGPFKDNTHYEDIKDYLSYFKYLSVRDKESYDIAKKMNLKCNTIQAFDLAVLLPKVYGIESKESKANNKVLGVSLCYYERYVKGDLRKEKLREEKSLKLLIKFAQRNKEYKIKLFIFNGNKGVGDSQITYKFYEQLKGYCKVEIINYTSDLKKFMMEMLECSIFYGIRLHSQIFAYSLNIPFLSVEYHKKCSEFLNYIKYEKEFRIGDNDLGEEEICKKLEELLGKKEIYKLKLEQAKELALLNFTELKKLDLI
jgi:polysaccharide pyruvyl transferase WcaK-like protein